MPVAVGSTSVPSSGGTGSSSGSGTVRAVDWPSGTWIDPTGAVWPLTDQTLGWFALSGVRGLGAAPVQYTTDPRERGGVSIRAAWNPARVITLPLYVEGISHSQFLDRWRALEYAFTCTERRGPGTLIVSRPDGSSRAIEAVYQDGFEGDPELGRRADYAVLSLLCPSPWWRSVDAIPIARGYTGAPVSFLAPYPTVSSSQSLGATTFVNPGRLPVWPDWRITGPAGTITATNVTRGESWTIDVSAFRGSALAADEAITITTDPPAITGPDGTSWYGALDNPSAVLWQLDEGSSDISFTVTGAGVGTSIEASFHALYGTA